MARKPRVEVEIVADDKASDDLKHVATEARALDGETVEVEVDADTSKATSSLDGLQKELAGLGGPVGDIGSKLGALASPAGAVALIGGGLLAAANHAADAAIEADNLAHLTGDTVDSASQLAALWKTTGADVNDLADVLLQMSQTLAQTPGLAKQLGINLQDGATGGERFQQVVEILNQIPDATQRATLASQLFGEQGVRQVNALTSQYEDLGAAIAEMPSLSAEDAEAARETKAEMAELTREFQQFAQTVGFVVLPVINALIGSFNDWNDLAFNIGRDIRGFFDDDAAKNFAVDDAFQASEEAARNFDRTLLDGLTTYTDVRAKALEVTGSMHAANLIANEWNRNQKLLNTTIDASTKKYRDFTDELNKGVEAQAALTEKVGEASISMSDMVDSFDQLEADALKKVFDLGNAPLDALTQTQDVAQKIRDFNDWFHEPETRVNKLEQSLATAKAALDPANPKEYAKQLTEVRKIQDDLIEARKQVKGIPNIFDRNDVNAAEFLDQIKALKGPLQAEIANAFGTAGPDAANKMALGFIDTLSRATGISPKDVAALLGLDQDFIAKVKVEIEVDEAKSQLALLEGILGTLPGGIPTQEKVLLASIKLGLDAKTITGEEALRIIQPRLREFGVTIPTEFAVPNSEQLMMDAQSKVNTQPPVVIPIRFQDPTGETARETRRLGVVVATPGSFSQPASSVVVNNIYPSGVTPSAVTDAHNIHISRDGTRVGP